jgi:hypothetical protein
LIIEDGVGVRGSRRIDAWSHKIVRGVQVSKVGASGV